MTSEPINVVVLGHLDNGKTTLCNAITKEFSADLTSVLVEGWSQIILTTKKNQYSLLDHPSAPTALQDLKDGKISSRIAILVVSVLDGMKEDDRAAIAIAHDAGILHCLVFSSKQKLLAEADGEMADIVDEEILEALTDNGLKKEDCPIIRGDALAAIQGDTGRYGTPSIRTLVEVLDAISL
ncbi:P-loop containing nucleoside triphosphate hydrolase protein [Aspergillus californicus]